MLKLIGPQPTISGKIVEVLKLDNLRTKQSTPLPLPSIETWGVCFFYS